MKKTLSQIAFDFIAEPGLQQAEAATQSPAGVGVRIKSLKSEAPAAEPAVVETSIIEIPIAAAEFVAAAPTAETSVVETPIGGPQADTSHSHDHPAKSKRGRKSLKQSSAEADLIEIPDDETLFLKQYYTMGEVAGMFRVNQSLLRFWETEFAILQPRKNKKGDRHFRPVDIKNLHLIYHLLRQRKYTIEGAKEFLKKNKKVEERFEAIQRLQQVKSFLLEWKAQL
jgi:DNA-binding transcriptional MerR regulator